MHVGNSSWAAAKLILAATIPIQKLVDHGGSTHLFINNQALTILQNDGYLKCLSYIKTNINYLNKGTLWADRGWKCFAHYYNPETGEGLNPWPNAIDECAHYFRRALYFWQKKRHGKSFFLLGAAAHLVQDLCVPHHARCIAFNGHQKFEKWAMVNMLKYKTDRRGMYDVKDITEILKHNASISSKFYDLVAREDEGNYNLAATFLLPMAQRATAGLFYLFMRSTELNQI